MSEERPPGDPLQAAFAALRERGAPTGACPEPDRLWAAALGEGTAEERQEVIDHMAACASCATAFRLARRLANEHAEGAATPGTPDAALVRRFPAARWIARPGPLAALAAVLLLMIAVPLWRNRTPPPYRDRPGEHTLRSEIAEGTVLPRDNALLRWSAGPPGTRYDVRVSTRQAQEVAVETGLDAPRYQVPPEALAGTASGTVLYWQVTAWYPDGASGTSPTFSFRVR